MELIDKEKQKNIGFRQMISAIESWLMYICANKGKEID